MITKTNGRKKNQKQNVPGLEIWIDFSIENHENNNNIHYLHVNRKTQGNIGLTRNKMKPNNGTTV